MPIPTPHKGEKKDEFISRCMGNETMVKEYDQEQRAAICYSQWRDSHKKEETAGIGSFAEKLSTGKWLIRPAVHTNMCKIADAYLKNPTPMKMDDNVETHIVKSQPGVAGQIDLHGVIHINGIVSKGVSEAEEQMFGLIDVDWIRDAINDLAMDDSVKDIILCWASPGGETTGIEELGRRIVEIDQNIKPIYSWCENQADSAAYWLSSQARMYGMTPSAQVGGIGVYVLVEDETEKLKQEGVKIEAISSGKWKMLGHEFRSLTDEERDILQEDVNKQHELFKATVSARRTKISPEDMEGLSFNGQDALLKGFVDVLADSIREFIGVIDGEKEYMKPQVEKVAAMAAIEPAKSETKAEVVKTASTPEVSLEENKEPTKFKSFISKLKELMGSYDGGYAEAVPGVPGTEEAEEAVPGTDYSKKAEEDHDEPDEDDVEDHEEPDEGDMCECAACKGTGKVKKAEKKAEEEAEEEDESGGVKKMEEEGEVKPPTKSEEEEGSYDGGYAKSNPLTREALMAACGISVPPMISPQAKEFQSMCHAFVVEKEKQMLNEIDKKE